MLTADSLNVASITLGLIAWMLPIINFFLLFKNRTQYWGPLSITSITACALSLCLQIFYTLHLVNIEDWGSLMDTHSAVAFVSAVLLISTIVLNTVTMLIHYKKEKMGLLRIETQRTV